jgi:hypothetical protein
VSELWFATRDFIQAGQLKGIDDQACSQLTTRRYTHKSRKYSIEPKDEYKKRVGRSPDHADCVVGIVEVARRNGASAAPYIPRPPEELSEGQDIYGDNDYNEPEVEPQFFDWFDGVESAI